MGGVLAVVNFDGAPIDPAVLKKMAEQCAYRGPDGIHYWIKGNVGLAHLALHATQESLREKMPMLSADGQLVLTADARVDNRPELMDALRAKGQPFPPDPTDADLIMAAYQCWDDACPEQIIGDYGFIIWDECKQRLFAARDVYGVKSLNYTRHGALQCVASEAQMIIQHPDVPRILDEIAVADFLVRNYNDEGHTMFKDVWAVRRAHSLVAVRDGMTTWRYWDIDPNYRITYATDQEYADKFLEIFTRCVSDRLRTPEGTNIGITMSGGMDSTSVAAVAQKLLNERGEGAPHLYAATYKFDTLKECDETEYSKAMADELGIDLTYIPAENFWYLDDDEAYTPSLENPYMAEESILRYIQNIFLKRHSCIWLTGFGGDNLLADSSLVYADRLTKGELVVLVELLLIFIKNKLSVWKVLQISRDWIIKPLVPDFLQRIFRLLRKSDMPGFLTEEFALRTEITKRLATISKIPSFRERARKESYSKAVIIDAIQGVFILTERQGSLNHLEARHPFFDRRLAEFLFAIPSFVLFNPSITKSILRDAMKGLLPEKIYLRLEKTEFSSYLALGLRQKETGKIWSILSQSSLRNLNMVYYPKVLDVYNRYLTGISNDVFQVWLLICFELWIKKYFQLIRSGANYE